MMRQKDDLGGFYFINEDSLQIKKWRFYFPSWGNCFLSLYSLCSLCCVCVLLVGESEESSGEIRGQRPHGRKRPPHALWG